MSMIKIERTHHLSIDEIRNRIEHIAVKLKDKLGVRYEWESERQLGFQKKGANGTICVTENEFQLTVKLGLMYRVLKTQIQTELESAVDKHIT